MKQSILIYDDDAEILLVSKLILEQKDYLVQTRECCDTIMEDITLLKPGIIFMDLWIPEMGGEQAIKLIKNNEKTRQIPVILFSARDDMEEIFSRSNANGYLKKPFSIEELIEVVKKNILTAPLFYILLLNHF